MVQDAATVSFAYYQKGINVLSNGVISSDLEWPGQQEFQALLLFREKCLKNCILEKKLL